MDKKTFLMGVAAGLVVAAVSFGAYNFAAGYGQDEYEEKREHIEQLLDSRYVDEVDKDAMHEAVYKAMAESLGDKYTEYMSAEEYKSYMESSQGSFYGIGVTISEDKENKVITVINTLKDSPAQKAGMLAGDMIIKVNDTDIVGYSLDEAVAVIKGEKGTSVKITVLRPETDETLVFDIVRDEVVEQSVAVNMLDDIGYIQISGFKKNTYNEFMDAYEEVLNNKAKGLIIDVRSNPGGLFEVVRNICDELVGEGVYVYTIDKSGKKEEFVSDEKCVEIPLYILVNEHSASASEILAGAVQGMDAGKLVGTTTYGKGLVQGLFALRDGSGLKITIQKYYTPDGICIQGEGITPDYEVELPEGFIYSGQIDLENDTQLLKAIELINE